MNAKQGDASTSEFFSFEYSYFYLNSVKSKILLACIYRLLEVSCNTFCEELELFLEIIFAKADILILVGDFNVWVDIEDDIDSKKLMNVMNAYGFSQLVHEPTHICGHTLDHVYVNQYQIELNMSYTR